ncbi:MAG: ribosome maturation factor RimP [Holophagales bacterium]|jgi:ribosome maturation factor RimP|nr:ribosome maturation factor RimP [Holophagales bacterium]
MDLKKLQCPIENQLSLLGFELVLLESAHEGRDEVLRLRVEHLDRNEPVTLDDCTAVSYGLNAWLDVEFPSWRETTGIEISSPGLERPLVIPKHYSRFVGHLCKVRTRLSLNGQKHFKGWINTVSDSSVTVEEDGILKQIPFDLIQKANLAPFDEDNTPKPRHAPITEHEGAEKSASREA